MMGWDKCGGGRMCAEHVIVFYMLQIDIINIFVITHEYLVEYNGCSD